MNLEGIGTVFKSVVKLCGSSRKFARFANRNKSRIETIGHCRTKNKAARFHAQHQVYVFVEVMLRKCVDQRSEAEFVFEQRRDVIEENAGLGKIWHFTD